MLHKNKRAIRKELWMGFMVQRFRWLIAWRNQRKRFYTLFG